MEIKKDELGTYVEFENDEEYNQIVAAARIKYKFKSKNKKTEAKYIEKLLIDSIKSYEAIEVPKWALPKK